MYDEKTLSKIEATKAFIDQNYGSKILIQNLADNVGMKPADLHRAFRAVVGISPYNYIINERLLKAADLLRTTNKSMLEIARAVGYNKQANFSEAFSKKYGAPPTYVRKHVFKKQNHD